MILDVAQGQFRVFGQFFQCLKIHASSGERVVLLQLLDQYLSRYLAATGRGIEREFGQSRPEIVCLFRVGRMERADGAFLHQLDRGRFSISEVEDQNLEFPEQLPEELVIALPAALPEVNAKGFDEHAHWVVAAPGRFRRAWNATDDSKLRAQVRTSR